MLTQVIKIQGCKKELGNYTFVDLQHPDKIGQHPNHPDQICYETPLADGATLEVKVTGETVEKSEQPKVAEVLLYCHATDCPFHKDHQPS